VKYAARAFLGDEEQPQRDTMQACPAGHVITDALHTRLGSRKKFCADHQLATISECANCHAPIPGALWGPINGYYDSVETVPGGCEECGTRFPWRVVEVHTSAEAAIPVVRDERRKITRTLQAETRRIAAVAKRLIDSDLKVDRSNLARDVQKVLADCASRGIMHSGAMIYMVEQVLEPSIRARGDKTVGTIKRALTESGITLPLESLRALFEGATRGMFDDAHKVLDDALKVAGISHAVEERRDALASVEADVRGRANAELELFAESLPRKEHTREVVAESPVSSKVFITHGRDKPMRDAVVNFIHSLQLQPIVLEDEPSGGLTIIEKYEKHAQVGYGVAILSPDDVGCLRGKAPGGLTPRARQNVIFELGYMFARITRHRVAVLLTDPNIERPTNIEGIVWIHLDAGEGWTHKLRKEFREAGLPLKD
jgi:predicted nucleotide-binding protein